MLNLPLLFLESEGMMLMQHKAIILINGKGGVGKDTLCDFAAKRYLVENRSSITRIKQAALEAGWDGQKDERGRKLLSDMKKIMVSYDSNIITNYLMEYTLDFLLYKKQVMFIHIREPEEIQKYIDTVNSSVLYRNLQAQGDLLVTSLLVTRDTGIYTYGNSGDDAVDDFMYHFVYHNDLPLSEAKYDFVDFMDRTMGLKDFIDV